MINKELLKGSTTTLVLTALHDKDMYGYDLMKELEEISRGQLIVKEGTLYPTLHALEKEGAIESYWVEKPDIRKRKYYRLTKIGKKMLKTRADEWTAFRQLIDRALATIKRTGEAL